MNQPQIQDADRKFVVQLINPMTGQRCPHMVVTQPEFEAAMRQLYSQYIVENDEQKIQDFLHHYVLILSSVEGNEAYMVDIPLFKVGAMLDILDLDEDAYNASLEARLVKLEIPKEQ